MIERRRSGQYARKPGELVQIDHLSVSLLPGHVIKDFKAIDPVLNYLVQRAYSWAAAGNAGRFLLEVAERLSRNCQAGELSRYAGLG